MAAMGPTAAMGVATAFGVASTGTAISALSGAAASNAALAWLGGGALAAGGGGIAAGEALLGLAGPIGWAIAGIALLGSGIAFYKQKTDKERLEKVFIRISKRSEMDYRLAIVELNERISRIEHETILIREAADKIATFGTDYSAMSESQKYELGLYVNLMRASTQLLVNPIHGIQPKYTEEDLDEYERENKTKFADGTRAAIIYLCNLLHHIDLEDKDTKLLYKFFKKDKELLSQFGIQKKDFVSEIMDTAKLALVQKDEFVEVSC